MKIVLSNRKTLGSCWWLGDVSKYDKEINSIILYFFHPMIVKCFSGKNEKEREDILLNVCEAIISLAISGVNPYIERRNNYSKSLNFVEEFFV